MHFFLGNRKLVRADEDSAAEGLEGLAKAVDSGMSADDVESSLSKRISNMSSSFAVGKRVAIIGASITNGSGASSNETSYTTLLDNYYLPKDKVYDIEVFGAGGQTVGQLLGYLDDVISYDPDVLILGVDLMTNGPTVSLEDCKANLESMINTISKNNIEIIATETIPVDSTLTEYNDPINERNIMMASVCSRAGITVLKSYATMQDGSTTYLNTSYDSGDLIHPNDAGHLAIAEVLSEQLNEIFDTHALPVNSGGMIVNPFMLTTSKWFNNTGSITGTRTLDHDEDVPFGNMINLELDGTTLGAGTNTLYTSIDFVGNEYAEVGDTLYICGYIKNASGVGTMRVKLLNQSFVSIGTLSWGPVGTGVIAFQSEVEIPDGTTWLNLGMTCEVDADEIGNFAIGYVQMYNLTRLGLA